jgi:hypothetical protein
MVTTTGLNLLDSAMMALKLLLVEVIETCSCGTWRAVKSFSDGLTTVEASMPLDSFQELNVSKNFENFNFWKMENLTKF